MKFEIANLRMYPTSNSTVKAMADIMIGKMLIIRDVRVIQGKSGFFMSMPARKSGDTFVNICDITDLNLKAAISDMLINLTT